MSAHGWYVTAAYGLSALAFILMIGWIVHDYRSRKREISELEARGIRRRSDTVK